MASDLLERRSKPALVTTTMESAEAPKPEHAGGVSRNFFDYLCQRLPVDK